MCNLPQITLHTRIGKSKCTNSKEVLAWTVLQEIVGYWTDSSRSRPFERNISMDAIPYLLFHLEIFLPESLDLVIRKSVRKVVFVKKKKKARFVGALVWTAEIDWRTRNSVDKSTPTSISPGKLKCTIALRVKWWRSRRLPLISFRHDPAFIYATFVVQVLRNFISEYRESSARSPEMRISFWFVENVERNRPAYAERWKTIQLARCFKAQCWNAM